MRCKECLTIVCQCDVNPIIARLEEIRKGLTYYLGAAGSLGQQLEEEIDNLKIKFGLARSFALYHHANQKFYAGTIIVEDERVTCGVNDTFVIDFNLTHNEVPMQEVRTLVCNAITAHVNK